MRRAACIALLWLGLLPMAQAQQLVADLTDHLVAITAGFHGTNVTLFGAIEGGGDVVVVVRGPERETVVRRKSRNAGIWLNTRSVAFGNAPGFYQLFSTKPIEEVVPANLRQLNEIGVDQLKLTPVGRFSHEEVPAFHAALIEDLQAQGLYGHGSGRVEMLGDKLFRATLAFPPNVPTGTYTVQIFQLHQGDIIAAQTTPLIISQTGWEADLNQFAGDEAVLYGIVAVLAAAMAGWGASLLFRNA
ncbi:MAG: TIGR02186 family protein [Aliidongia sp.]